MKKCMWDVIKIRNGEIARPEDYHRIYWDLVLEYSKNQSQMGRKLFYWRL